MFQPGMYHVHLAAEQPPLAESDNGNSQLEVRFNVTHVTQNGGWVNVPKEERTLFLSCTDNAWPYTVKKLKALGWNGDMDAPKYKAELYETGLEMECKSDVYQNKPREKWELADWGGREVKPASTDARRTLAAKWRAAQGPAAPAPSTRPTAPPARSSAPSPAPAPRSAPAPSSNGAATATADLLATTRDETWAFTQRIYDGKDKTAAEIERIFFDGIAAVSKTTGRQESEFTADDWNAVAADIDIPF